MIIVSCALLFLFLKGPDIRSLLKKFHVEFNRVITMAKVIFLGRTLCMSLWKDLTATYISRGFFEIKQKALSKALVNALNRVRDLFISYNAFEWTVHFNLSFRPLLAYGTSKRN